MFTFLRPHACNSACNLRFQLRTVSIMFLCCLSLQELGFVGSKVPCPYGPAQGDDGLRRNVEFFAGCRKKVGDDFPLMYVVHTAALTMVDIDVLVLV